MSPWPQITGRSNIIVNLDAPICPICCALEMACRQLARNQMSWNWDVFPIYPKCGGDIPKYFDIYINQYWCQKVIATPLFKVFSSSYCNISAKNITSAPDFYSKLVYTEPGQWWDAETRTKPIDISCLRSLTHIWLRGRRHYQMIIRRFLIFWLSLAHSQNNHCPEGIGSCRAGRIVCV